MRVLEVIINDISLDIESRIDFPLLLKKQILSFGQVDSRGDVTSFTVKFPSTQKNLTALNLNLNLDNYGKFYSNTPYETTILINTIELMRGIFVLSGFNDDYIEGYIQSTAIGQSRLIGNKKLNELNFPTIPFLGMETIIQNQLDQTIDPIYHSQNNTICFPPVSYGTYFIPYKQTSGQTIDITAYTAALNADVLTPYDVPKWAFEDLPPSVYVRAIMRQIFNDIGYTLSGSQINSSDLDNLIMPFTAFKSVNYNQNTIGGYYCDLVTQRIFIEQSSTSLTQADFANRCIPVTDDTGAITIAQITGLDQGKNVNGLPIFTNNYSLSHIHTKKDTYQKTVSDTIGQDTSTQYSPTDNVTYKLYGNLRFIIDPTVNTPVSKVKLAYVKTDGSPLDSDFITGGTLVGASSLPLDPTMVVFETEIPQNAFNPSYNISLDVNFTPEKGQGYRQVIITQNAINPLTVGYIEIVGAQSFYGIRGVNSTDEFTLQGVDDIVENTDRKFSGNLPADITQLDFVKSMISIFNLQFYVNEDKKTITFETQNNFYSPKQSAYELRGKTRLIEQVTTTDKLLFQYSNDPNDFLTNGDIDQNYTKSIQLRVRNENQIISNIFAKTEMKTYRFIENQSTTPVNYLNEWFEYLQNPNFKFLSTAASNFSIDIPQISDEEEFNSPQSDFYSEKVSITVLADPGPGTTTLDVQDKIEPAYVVPNRKHTPRLLRLTTPYSDSSVLFPLLNQDTLNNEAIITYQQTISQANNENLTQEYFYDNYWFNTIQEYERSELVTFEVYIDYTDYIQLQSNRLLLIDGIFYRLIEFAPFNPLNPKPILLKLLKVF